VCKKHDRGSETWSLITGDDLADALGFVGEQKGAFLKHVDESHDIAIFMNGIIGERAVAAL